MYNKIFSKILDSSIWLESDPTRIVWLTCIAAMDEDGFCSFASPANLARRANVPIDACQTALTVLEGPDINSSDADHEGRRLERVPGGWIVLNATKYRDLVTRIVARESTRLRVKRHRDKRNASTVTAALPNVSCNASEAVSEASAVARSDQKHSDARFARFWSAYPKKTGKGEAEKKFTKLKPSEALLDSMLSAIAVQVESRQWQDEGGKFIPLPATWLNQRRWEDGPTTAKVPLLSAVGAQNRLASDEAARILTEQWSRDGGRAAK